MDPPTIKWEEKAGRREEKSWGLVFCVSDKIISHVLIWWYAVYINLQVLFEHKQRDLYIFSTFVYLIVSNQTCFMGSFSVSNKMCFTNDLSFSVNECEYSFKSGKTRFMNNGDSQVRFRKRFPYFDPYSGNWWFIKITWLFSL